MTTDRATPEPAALTGGAADGAGKDPLRLEVCPECAYSLRGLPAAGACPECGTEYDAGTVILFGWGRGYHAHPLTGRPASAAYFVVLVGLNLVLMWWILGTLHPLLPLGSSAVLVFFAAAVLWRRRATAKAFPGLIQVRLSAAGCTQPDYARRSGAVATTPWARIDHVSLEPAADDDGAYRLTLGRRGRGWDADVPAVDADVRCTPEQAEALWRRIEAWRAQSPPGFFAAEGDGLPPLEEND